VKPRLSKLVVVKPFEIFFMNPTFTTLSVIILFYACQVGSFTIGNENVNEVPLPIPSDFTQIFPP